MADEPMDTDVRNGEGGTEPRPGEHEPKPPLEPASEDPAPDADGSPSDTEGIGDLEAQLPALLRSSERAAAQQKEPLIRQWLLLLPRLVRFLWRVARDDKVSARWKSRCLIVIAYVVSPIDLIPDWIPVVGLIDDLYVALVLFDRLLNHLPRPIFERYWDGGQDVIDSVRAAIRVVIDLLPKTIREVLDGFFGDATDAPADDGGDAGVGARVG